SESRWCRPQPRWPQQPDCLPVIADLRCLTAHKTILWVASQTKSENDVFYVAVYSPSRMAKIFVTSFHCASKTPTSLKRLDFRIFSLRTPAPSPLRRDARWFCEPVAAGRTIQRLWRHEPWVHGASIRNGLGCWPIL